MQLPMKSPPFVILVTLLVSLGHGYAAPIPEESFLQEVWRTDPDEPPFFRSLSDFVLVGDELFVLDKRSFLISVYSVTNGRHLRDLDIHGDGPGELTGVISMEAISDSTLGIFSPFGPSMVFIDSSIGGPSYEFGNSRVTFSYEKERGYVHSYRCEYKDGKLYYSGKDLTAEELFLTRADVATERREFDFFSLPAGSRFSGGPPVIDERDSYVIGYEGWCVGDDERVYYSAARCGHGQLEIVTYEGDHRSGVISLPYDPRKRSDVEKEAIKRGELGGDRGFRQFAAIGGTIKIDDYDPDILEMFEYEGRLWVRTSRSDELSGERRYEIFSPDGRYLGRHSLKFDGVDWGQDRVIFLGDFVVIAKDHNQEELMHFIVAKWE